MKSRKQDASSDQESAMQVEVKTQDQTYLISEETNYLCKYQSLLNIQKEEDTVDSELVTRLSSQGIRYNPTTFQEHLQVIIQSKNTNCEGIKIHVAYGHFSTTLNIINVQAKSSVCSLAQNFKGSFGVVYKSFSGSTPVAIKCVQIGEDNFKVLFREVVKQYFLLTIASALKVGPILLKIFGFDIVIFRDSIAFSMEFCEMSNYNINSSLPLLQKKLQLLHSLQIVHLDIKPDNIAFSSTLKEYIFIDFGLSRIIKEQLGSKTFTSFLGSLSYCYDEMVKLYLDETSGFVDLYYNDAFGLDKSLSYLKKLQAELPDEPLFKDRPNFEEFCQCESLLKVKFSLFQFSLTKIFQASFFSKYRTFIQRNRVEIYNFILTLPQSLSFISFYKKQLKNQLKFDQYEVTTHDEIIKKQVHDRNQIPFLFSQRLFMISCINQTKEELKITIEKTNILLDNVQSIKTYRFSYYKLALMQFIKINGAIVRQFFHKVWVCKVFSELHLNLTVDLSGIQIYKMTVLFIFQGTFIDNEPQSFQTLKNALETVMILEIVSEERFIRAYEQVLDMQISFSQKMFIILQFISALEFIKEKYQTIYSYSKLSTIFMTKLNEFLCDILPKITNEHEMQIINNLQFLIGFKIPTSQEVTFKKQVYRATSKETMRLKQLNQKIRFLLICHEVTNQIDRYNFLDETYFKTLLIWINSINHNTYRFIFPHFVLYNAAFQTNQTVLNQPIYQLFLDQFKDFEVHKHFKIYFLNKLNRIKFAYSKALLKERKQIDMKIDNQNQKEIEYSEIFRILDYVVKNKNEFHSYLGSLFNIVTIYSSAICANYVIDLINNNQQKIIDLSYNLHQEGINLHNNQLKHQISVVSNLFQFYRLQNQNDNEYTEAIVSFMKKCEQLISKSTCFQCKVNSLLELKGFQANYKIYKQQTQESFLCVTDIMILYLKNKSYFKNTFNIMISLIRRWRRFKTLYKKYNLQQFLYEYITVSKRYHYCLFDIRQINIFINLYFYIGKMYPNTEMATFILGVTESISEKKSIHFINNFYYSLLHIIKMNKEGKDIVDFKQYHDTVIYSLLSIPNIREHPYVSLYFSALLQIQIRSHLQKKMLQVISFSINFTDKYTRSLILNRYFYNYTFYLRSSEKKRTYLCHRHLKKCSDKFSLKFLLKTKLKKCPQNQGSFRIKLKQMKKFIQRYHSNLENIL